MTVKAISAFQTLFFGQRTTFETPLFKYQSFAFLYRGTTARFITRVENPSLGFSEPAKGKVQFPSAKAAIVETADEYATR